VPAILSSVSFIGLRYRNRSVEFLSAVPVILRGRSPASMSRTTALTLIASRHVPVSTGGSDDGARTPLLARLAGRGAIERIQEGDPGLRSWQQALLQAVELPIEASAFRSAPLSAAGLREDASGFWLHAEPMHFAAGMSDIAAAMLSGAARPTAAELALLTDTLAPHLRADGFELALAPDGWLLRSTRHLAVTTVTPEVATAEGLKPSQPQGEDARELRRLMTELQMLLHEHPVNEHRARVGLPAINAVWLWGQGVLQTGATEPRLPQAFSDEPYVRGLYRAHGQTVGALPDDANSLMASDVHAERLVVIQSDDLEEIEVKWIAPLRAALSDGSVARLQIFIDGVRVSATRLQMHRFWRRDLAPREWSQA
jgi:hypothetical protein